jgi:light-regulated signal transduction histidine kinase (bacteriophytochrome)
MLNSPQLSLSEQMLKASICTPSKTVRAKMYAIIESLLLLSEVRQQADIPITPLDMSKIVTEALSRLNQMIEQSSAEIIQPNTWPSAMGLDSVDRRNLGQLHQ